MTKTIVESASVILSAKQRQPLWSIVSYIIMFATVYSISAKQSVSYMAMVNNFLHSKYEQLTWHSHQRNVDRRLVKHLQERF